MKLLVECNATFAHFANIQEMAVEISVVRGVEAAGTTSTLTALSVLSAHPVWMPLAPKHPWVLRE
jgi:hypothetical protein